MTGQIRERLARVHEQIRCAAQRSGRNPQGVTLIAVSKTFTVDYIQRAVDAGVTDFGENRVQEASLKVGHVSGSNIKWHMIGHLQSNKARAAVSIFDVIHSIDSVSLIDKLDSCAVELGRRPSVLLQVNLAKEQSKTGASEEQVSEIAERLDSTRNLQFKGLMTLPPLSDSPEDSRKYFITLRRLLESLNKDRPEKHKLTELSMGMSSDFEVAIEEGATMVRVGTAIFGSRGG